MRWTPEKVAELKVLAAMGLGSNKVAERMGITTIAARRQAVKLRVSLRRGAAFELAWAAESEARRKAAVRSRWKALIGPLKEALRRDIADDDAKSLP